MGLRRLRVVNCYLCGEVGKRLSLGKVRHIRYKIAVPVVRVRLSFQCQTVAAFKVFPPGTEYRFPFAVKELSAQENIAVTAS